MFLSRKQCNELRGLAISFIVLHNFIHQGIFGFTTQNESSFSYERTLDFLARVNDSVGSFLGELFSFLGWIGVPVFVFLSGYGLVKKYEQGPGELSIMSYIKRSWLKLFLLMLPGVLFFALFHQLTGIGGLNVQLKYAAYLSLFGNFFGIDSMTPSIYWYFGLTFELYLVYIVLNRFPSKILLALCFILPLLIQLIFLYLGYNNLVHFNLRNFIGWLPVFCTGVYLGRQEGPYDDTHDNHSNNWTYLLLLLLSAGMVVLCNLSPWSWVMIHFASLLFFYSVIQLFKRHPQIESAFAFIGTYASFVFAAHPISRLIVNEFGLGTWRIGIQVLLYIFILIILVPLYKYIVGSVSKPFSGIQKSTDPIKG